MTVTTERRAMIATGTAVAVLIGVTVIQYVRSSWPFTSEAAASGDPHAGHPVATGHQGHGDTPSGYAGVMLASGEADAIGLATAIVDKRTLTRAVRTVGVVTLDETRTTHVHARVRGWIETIAASYLGKTVTAGQVLCTIYSQDVYAAEAELVAVLDRPDNDPLRIAARRRLALWDVPKSEIARLETTREPSRTFPLLAPRGGTVIAKVAIEGTFVDPASELFTLSDLSQLWAQVDLYERDAPYVRVGDTGKLTVEGIDQPIEGKVVFLAPTIDEATRTVKARFVLDNRRGALRPGAFVAAELTLALGDGLTIPETAVIRTGTRAIVFLVHGNHIQPREVTLGPASGEFYRVEHGLAEGDRVAVGAQFLLDSESRLRASGGGGGHAH